MKIKNYAIVRLQKEGVHFWKAAKGKEVFLKYPHRHMFWIEVWIEQLHTNREIEYIACKRWLEKKIKFSSKTSKSCEAIAQDILRILIKKDKNKRSYKIFVKEDGENGCCAEYNI